jgi:hypothetical protein
LALGRYKNKLAAISVYKRKALNLFRKREADSMFFSLSGRLFQSLGAALLKALAPDRFLLVTSTAGRLKRDWEQERNRRDGS